MNIIEKRKGQLKMLGIMIIILSSLMAIGGIVMVSLCGISGKLNIALLVVGILLIFMGLVLLGFGIVFGWVSSAVKATKGSIAQDNLGKGTVNMHKCENCGAEVEAGTKICAKCEENLKP